MSMKADPATASSSGTVASRRLPRRIHWLVTAAIAAISSGIAVVQDPRPDPFTSPALLTADWWKYPRERNAFKRVHALTATLNSVYAIRGTGRVWAVGNGGLLIHSEDGGRTWRQDSIVAPQTHSREQEPSGSADVSQNAGPMVQGEVDTDTSYAGRPPLTTQSKAQNPPGGKGFSPRDSTPKGDDPGPLQASSARLTDNFHDVYFASPLRGWVAGGQGLIAQTMDGGGTWTVGRIAGANDIVAGWFGPDSVWFVVDRDGTPFWTGDSGEWAGSRADGPSTVRSFSAVSAKFGYVVTSEGAVQPSKVGVDISFRGSRQGPFREISFIDSLRGWATDSNGGLWTTTDAGGRWDSLPGQSTSLRGRINFSDVDSFGRWGSLTRYRERFKRLSTGLRIS